MLVYIYTKYRDPVVDILYLAQLYITFYGIRSYQGGFEGARPVQCV